MAAPANGAAPLLPQEIAAKLLDVSQPLDVALLDRTVDVFYGAGSNQEVSCGSQQLLWGGSPCPTDLCGRMGPRARPLRPPTARPGARWPLPPLPTARPSGS